MKELIAITATLWITLLVFLSVPAIGNTYLRWVNSLSDSAQFWIHFLLRFVYIIPTFLTLYKLFWYMVGYLITISQQPEGFVTFGFGFAIGSLVTLVIGIGILAVMAMDSKK